MIHIFIVNAKSGKKEAVKKLRADLAKIDGLDYHIFLTRRAGDETELVRTIKNIFEGEQLRFYACGGSGTMRNMLDGFDDLSKAEVAMVPFGTNDFLKVFGDKREHFNDIEKIIHGEPIFVDYIKTSHGVALNSMSTGIDAYFADAMRNIRGFDVFGEIIPYFMATMYAIFLGKNQRFEITLDEEVFRGRPTEVFFGNGSVLGGFMHLGVNNDYRDGYGSYVIVKNRGGLARIPVLFATIVQNRKMLNKRADMGVTKKLNIRRADGGPFYVNLDGELKYESDWKAEIINQGLKLVVPKEVCSDV